MRWFKCCYCKETKTEDNFYHDKSKPTGYRPRCKECERLYRNKERRRQYEKEYREKHPERRRKILANYYRKNKEKHRKQQGKYRQTMSFYKHHKQHGAIRRAREKMTFVESVDYYKIYQESDGRCFYCNQSLLFKEAEFDHYIPISRGGSHKKDNIKCSCQRCNRSKGALLPQEWEVYHQMV